MWESHSFYLSYKNPKYLIVTTLKNFSVDNLPCQGQDIKGIPLLSYEKTYCLHKLLENLNLEDKKLLLCEQIHGNQVIYVTDVENLSTIEVQQKTYKYKLFREVDGILTSKNDFAVVVFTADCVPLFVYHLDKTIFGIVHIGRKGLEAGIVDNFVKVLFDITPDIEGIRFLLGPHICEKCYIVNGKPYSLANNILKVLFSWGITENQVVLSNYCTCHNLNLFFSYYRDKTSYRHVSLITHR